MKLAILIHGGVDRSGTERVIPGILWMLERLARHNDVHVFSFNQEPAPGEWNLVGARVHNTGTAAGWRGRLFRTFAAEHRVAPFRVLHAIFGWGGTYGAALAWRHRIPMLFHAAGGEFVGLDDIDYGMRATLVGRIQLGIACTVAKRVSCATGYMQHLVSIRGVRADVVPLGVALDRWPPSEVRRRDVSSPAILLHIGDVRPVKDQAMLLAAAVRLRDAGIPFELHMAGADTMHGALRESANARALGDQLHWHGVLNRSVLRALVDRAHVLLVSSRHEAGPVAVLEAAVAGVPTVGTAVGHVADWSPDAAVPVPVSDPQALAREIAALLHNEPRRVAMAEEAQRRAIAIDADHSVAEFERIYREMVASAGR